ncbi:hypothetical protein [Nocardioides litoris]|uniref:hypothetical protein n=1 Tax=Nocardioides litoris TaxID=1926648 RepID=UPI00112344E3|nr:hypothetical protein [Nocardioides litoris]
MSEGDLGPKPEPVIEPGEPNPGGTDALEQADGVDGEAATADPVPRDLDPDDNPETGEIPTSVKEGEDTSTEATRGDGSEGDGSEGGKESPA